MFLHKYIKYKHKYLQSKYMTGGSRPSKILLDGVSSSGKTSISRFFQADGYKEISIDDYPLELLQRIVYADLPDAYVGPEKIRRLLSNTARKLMFEESEKYPRVIFDDINQHLLDVMPRDQLYIVIVYAPLSDLVNNMIRRKTVEPRGLFVFNQFAKKYVQTDHAGIDIVNRAAFVHDLKKIKYEFASEDELIGFAAKIFSLMGIDDDRDHHIGVRKNLLYDYVVNTHGKSPEKIYEEIQSGLDIADVYETE